MADFSNWVGGDFVYSPQWGSGRSNDGSAKKKFGLATMRKRARFNPNPTRSSQPSCLISARSAADKAKYIQKQKERR